MNEVDKIIEQLHTQLDPNKHICSGCGHEHNCGREGCRIIRDAIACLKAAIDELRQYGECDSCIHIVSTDDCEAADFFCKDCDSKSCVCKSCDNGNRWEFHLPFEERSKR